MHNSNKFFIAISELEEKYGLKLKSFPYVVVMGAQSSGKSSVIEALCGQTILPKDMKMSTMKPCLITTVRSEEMKIFVGEKEYKNNFLAAEEISRLNKNSTIKEINIKVYGPDLYNSYLVDIPGLFVVASKENMSRPRKVKEITTSYLENNQVIPVNVRAAPLDPANDPIMKLVRKYNREDDAFGILTKIDMLENTQNTQFIQDMLNNETYNLGYGYCAVSLRNDKDIKLGKSINDKIIEEKNLLDRMKLAPGGVNQMRKIISDIQLNKIKDQIPLLLEEIDLQIVSLKSSGTFLSNLINNDQKQLVAKLHAMIEKLVNSSSERAEFEDILKKRFKQNLGTYIIQETKNTKYIAEFTEKSINRNIFLYNSLHKNNPHNYAIDGIKELFSYGLLSPVFLDNETLSKTVNNEIGLATAIPLIQFTIDDSLGKKRINWNKELNRYFTKLLEDENVHKLIHNITEQSLLEYICDETCGSDELTKNFTEYMIKQISKEAFESKIKYSITAMINIEKRPHVSIFEISRYITQMFPQYFTFYGNRFETWRYETKQLNIEIYSEEWNEAYMKVVTDKITENCYRNISVNLLDSMVRGLLILTIDMFNKENVVKEQNKVNEKISKLMELRNIISDTSISFSNNKKNNPECEIKAHDMKKHKKKRLDE